MTATSTSREVIPQGRIREARARLTPTKAAVACTRWRAGRRSGAGVGRSTSTGDLLRQVGKRGAARSEEHTSELHSLMRISNAVFFLKKTLTPNTNYETQIIIH